MTKSILRVASIASFALAAWGPGALAADPPPWKDASTGYSTLFDFERSSLDDARRQSADEKPVWTDAATGYATLFDFKLSHLDDAARARKAEEAPVWIDAATGYWTLFEHRPYTDRAKAAASGGTPDGV